MKLASLKSSRDGTLCIVNKSLSKAIKVDKIAKTMQDAIENWDTVEPRLRETYQKLNSVQLEDSFAFRAEDFSSPFPRSYQWLDGSAYVNHVELVRKSRGVEMPENFWHDPLMYQGGSDKFIGPCDDVLVADEAYGIDFEAEVAIVIDNVPMGVNVANAASHIKLLMLVNDVSLRNLALSEVAKGFGFLQAKPASSFSPVAVTPDELGDFWDGNRINLPLKSYLNNQLFGEPNASDDMIFSFPQLISHAARTRELTAGTIIGSGTVSNKDRSRGSSCIVEKRMLEILSEGKATTPFMSFGDSIRIEMRDLQDNNIFGSIEQKVAKYKGTHETL
ncbi:MAG: 2-keto-4-pentenoate hydratase [Legionellales bacterium RIFCSPHIGHO2_12_FULL_35_11]|nr:MAG: 2-keto-4-pentenoate hydratase [Legionellales bacterium RIFCSPHIGHO2_12_FULL_35_11]